MESIKQLLKGRKIIIYARVSGKQQRKTLPSQLKDIRKLLKDEGVKDSQIIGSFSEQASGTNIERTELLKALELAEKQRGKVALVVRDLQRFTRNGYALGFLIWPFLEAGIPVVDLLGKRATSTKDMARPDDDLLMLITAAIGAKEVATGIKRTERGRIAAEEGGIVRTRIDFMPKFDVNPIELMIDLQKRGLPDRKIAEMLGRGRDYARKNLKRVEDILSQPNGKTILKEWLEVVNMVRNMEIMHGYRYQIPKGAKPTKKMIAVGRMTSGYLDTPYKFAKPTQADLDEYYENYTKYQPKR